jgi:transposase-like protein
MTGVFRLLRLAVRCPVCGAPPAMKISPGMARRFEDLDPAEQVQTYQCPHCMKKRIVVHYPITAGHYQQAR